MSEIRFGIRGTGSAVPERRLTNDDLTRMVETSDEWITQRTGIKERRILSDGETTSDMALAAARRALDDAGVGPAEIDLIVVATVTPDRRVSATACKLQVELGCRPVPAFDMAAGCTGFVYAVSVASQFLAAGTCRNVLVIGAESLSRITNYEDRTSCILFGDAAGAAVLSSETWIAEILSSHLAADGAGYDVMYQTAGGAEKPLDAEALAAQEDKLVIRGREVYKFAVSRMVELVRTEVSANAGLELGAVIPHQVNARILESARDRLGMESRRIYINIDRYGNTSSASVPVALDEARREGFFEDLAGRLVVLCAFGAGLTWGSVALRWGNAP